MALIPWPAEYAQGQFMYISYLIGHGHTQNSAENEADYYRRNNYRSDMEKWQKAAGHYASQGGASGSASNNALFGTPIDTSRPNLERIHALVLAAGQDSGQHDHKPGAYNPQAVKMWALRNRDGTYRTPAGLSTRDPYNAQRFYTQAEAFAVKKDNQTIVEI